MMNRSFKLFNFSDFIIFIRFYMLKFKVYTFNYNFACIWVYFYNFTSFTFIRTRDNCYVITYSDMHFFVLYSFIKPPVLVKQFLKSFYLESHELLDQILVFLVDYYLNLQLQQHYHQIE